MTSLAEIERKTKTYADARARLAALVEALNDTIEALKRDSLPDIKRALGVAAQHENELRSLLQEAPELFVRPRTVIFHGIKVGYAKGKGGIVWEDEARVVALIHKHFAEQAETLIRTKETPVKDALAQLTVADLRRLGCSVEEAGDQVVIRATDSAVDKLVARLIQEATEEVST